MFHLRFESLDRRDAFIRHMADRDVLAVFHYQALHESPVGQRLGERHSCPVASSAARTLVRLPLFNDMSDSEQAAVIDAALAFR